MKFIVYISHTEKFWSAEDILNLAEDSARRNEKKGLTGVLVYRPQKNRSSGDFLQVIEGESEDVDVFFKKILKDRRHNSILIVSEGEIENRTFNDWFMGIMDLEFAISAPSAIIEDLYNVQFWQNLENSNKNGLYVLKQFCRLY